MDIIKRKECLEEAKKYIEQLEDNFDDFAIYIGYKKEKEDRIFNQHFVMAKSYVVFACFEMTNKFLRDKLHKGFTFLYRRNKIAQWIIEKISAKSCHCQCHKRIRESGSSSNVDKKGKI